MRLQFCSILQLVLLIAAGCDGPSGIGGCDRAAAFPARGENVHVRMFVFESSAPTANSAIRKKCPCSFSPTPSGANA